jgi:hypothetical protein
VGPSRLVAAGVDNESVMAVGVNLINKKILLILNNKL